MWGEIDGKKGALEIANCIRMRLEEITPIMNEK